MSPFEKDPEAVLDYRIDWTNWLQTGETISTSAWTVPSTLTQPTAASNTTTTATVWLGGGEDGTTYRVTNRIVTTGGRTNERSLTIFVRHQ